MTTLPLYPAQSRETILDAVRHTWGYDELRPLQEEAIRAGLDHRDSLVVLPTGGGKSLCYQVPPLLVERTDMVISPLISLMKDQVDGLRANGYPAVTLHSAQAADDRAAADEPARRPGCRPHQESALTRSRAWAVASRRRPPRGIRRPGARHTPDTPA